jgi:hypothetical protein
MKDTAHRIFRPEALQRHLRGLQTPVWPRLVAPPIFLCIWILAVLLLMTGVSAWSCKIPVYVPGVATVVQRPDGEMLIVAFFAPEHLPRLRAGQTLVLSSQDGRSRFSEAIVAVKSDIISPDAARQQFALGPGAAHVITEPSAVAMARLEASHFSLPAGLYLASAFRAEVEVGTRRVMSLLPLIGRVLEAYSRNSPVLVILRTLGLRETGRFVSEMLAGATRHKRAAV